MRIFFEVSSGLVIAKVATPAEPDGSYNTGSSAKQ
jgi:hypothetical protein